MKRLNHVGIFFLLCVLGLQVSGQEQFVFYVTDGSTNYFLKNNGTAWGNSSTFDPSTCVFNGAIDDNGFYTFTNSGQYLRHAKASSPTTISMSSSNETDPECGEWTIGCYGLLHSSKQYIKGTSDLRYLYLRYGSGWNVNTKLDDPTIIDDSDPTKILLYSATFRYIPVDGHIVYNNHQNYLLETGTYDFSASWLPSYHLLQGYKGINATNYYYWNSSLHDNLPTATTTGYTFNYSLSANSYTSINSTTGELTVTSLPSTIQTITLTITASQGGTVVDTKDITLYLYPANTDILKSGVYGNKVVLYDYEDHNWAYYAGYNDYNETTAANKYNNKYLGKIYNPDPRNVKITYKGGGVSGTSAVAISREANEQQNEMVYYTTLEKFVIGEFTDANTDGVPDDYSASSEWYPYTVIPNPFSKRPRTTGATGTDGFYGFAGWKIISGSEHIQRTSGKPAPEDGVTVLDLDEKIHFIGLNTDYTPNCTSAEIVLEATWAPATVKTGNAAQSFTGGTYETNFLVITSTVTSAITQNSPCTIMGIYPDGTGTMTTINGVSAGTDNVKVEWVNSGTGNWNANGHDFTIGRGVTTTVTGKSNSTFQGLNVHGACQNVVRIESGTFGRVYFHHYTGTATSTDEINMLTIFGCDYDRARAHPEDADDEYTNKLVLFRTDNTGESSYALNRSEGQLYWRGIIKSGKHIGWGPLPSEDGYTAGSAHQFYCGAHKNFGHRCLTLEGGRINGITGGSDGDNVFQNEHRALTVRMKGNACVLGCIVGAASSNMGSGDRVFVITGGKIGGWVAGGANGDEDKGGTTVGNSYIYIGGNVEVDSKLFYSPRTLNHSFGGMVFGAGCGIGAENPSGSMEESTNVVLADNGYVERGIYGGGAYGRTANVSKHLSVDPMNVPANIYILGGHIGGVDGTNDTGEESLEGGVFGGASLNDGCSSNIYIYGGIVEGGIYGGSNASGGMFNDVNVQILGGQVGTATAAANVHGGGLGSGTRVFGSVDVTVGKSGATDGATIYGDVYGGSAEGTVNIDTLNVIPTGSVTNVTLNVGTVNGNVYGGGLGTSAHAADVFGPVQVNVNGGTVDNVFGCNNTKGAPKNTVDVNMTGGLVDECVYGGGNAAAYTAPANETLDVTISGGEVKKNVFGGGLGSSAVVTGNTNVKVIGTSTKVDGNVYGGGSAADVDGNTNVTIGGE